MINRTHEKYTIDEVKTKFQYVRKANEISNAEYDLFCEALSGLTTKILDAVEKDVCFALLSVDPKIKATTGCYINTSDYEGKKGIICLTPLYFLLCPSDQKQEILRKFFKFDKQGFESRLDLYHEIAHYYLNHKDVSDLKERNQQEEEANNQANKWLRGEFD